MSIATVSSKGQITLPADMRRALGIHRGDRVSIRVHGDAIVIEPVPDFLSLKGMLGPALPREVEEEAARSGAVERSTAGR